ncbi:lipase secretion chaperone [Moritella dasanensis]|uniref:lipase secretion chaperone n=1 Tax=Moritella dasanensis TaxID=428031 RepID=UPI0003748196|nr:lipase secretion chaperone [Moritella dasanensis]
MSLKSSPLIVVGLSSVIALVGGTLFFSQGYLQEDVQADAHSIVHSIAAKSTQQASYPLAPEAIDALVNRGDNVLAKNIEQQAVPLLLPSSLLGSPLPLTLDVNEFGELVINKKIQHLFDFYLSAMGEESLDIIVTRIQHSLKLQLTEPALTQGMDILSGYLQYLNEVTAIKQQFEQSIDGENSGEYALDNVIQVREMVLDARASYLDDDVIVAFFGQADEYEAYMLSLATINKNVSFNSAEKQAAKAALDTTAPTWLLTQQHNANQLNQYRQQYQALQAQGASQAELQDFTQQSFSPEVADRLAVLDEKRQQWQIKLAEYRKELTVITHNAPDDNSDSEQQQLEIAQLREAYFSPQEIKRVSALDSIDSTRRNSTGSNTSAPAL